MIPATSFAGRRVAVFGLGRSGNATCRSLIAGGAEVAAWDDNEASRAQAALLAVPIVDLRQADWTRFDSLVLAPGVPLTHPAPHWVVLKAQAASVEVIGDVEIFFRERRAAANAMEHPVTAPVIAITGTNGKSTTTALIGHVLASHGLDVQVGGNIGTAVLDLEPPTPDRFYVLELSSYQIDLTPTLDPWCGILLNITPDHIDRHGTFETYAGVKARMVETATLAIIGIDRDMPAPGDPRDICLDIARRRQAAGLPLAVFSRRRPTRGGIIHGDAGHLVRICAAEGFTAPPGNLVNLGDTHTLKGAHNLENAAAAFLVAEFLGVAHDEIAAGLKTFPGLAHRLEQIRCIGRVSFVNDSKATNADSTDKALAAFGGDIFWIAGGQAKDGGIEPLRPYFPRIRRAYLIGDAAALFAATIGEAIDVVLCGTLEAAVLAAACDADAAAAQGAEAPVVLLSPACASFDQFRSFEHRGDTFRQLVAALPDPTAPTANL